MTEGTAKQTLRGLQRDRFTIALEGVGSLREAFAVLEKYAGKKVVR